MRTSCLAETELDHYVGRTLPRAALTRLDAHTERCPACAARLVALAQCESLDDALSPAEEALAQRAALDPWRASSLALLLLARGTQH
ncbi:MAG TPA: hypothetical protein VG389_17485 [Myxococcota bacterium]|jgi:anti-sigma factor RsiW|nr:hypothetical protein [Myxococcota bacterium]